METAVRMTSFGGNIATEVETNQHCLWAIMIHVSRLGFAHDFLLPKSAMFGTILVMVVHV